METFFSVDRFTDPTIEAAYTTALNECQTSQGNTQALQIIRQKADDARNRQLDRGLLATAACTYLVLAQKQITLENDNPERFFHFSANAFRDMGLLQKAAECYFNSAVEGLSKSRTLAFARRSAGRAKAIFSEIGDDELSDRAHVLQQEIKRTQYKTANPFLGLLFWLWKKTTTYGTSPSRWGLSLAMTIFGFAGLYYILLSSNDIQPASGTEIDRNGVVASLISALYYSIGNLVQFGTLGYLVPKSILAQVVFVMHSCVAFVLLGTGATFLIRK